MGNIIEGFIALLLSYKVNEYIQPYLEDLTSRAIEKGLAPEVYQGTLNEIEMYCQLIAFLVIFGIIELAKFIYHCRRESRL